MYGSNYSTVSLLRLVFPRRSPPTFGRRSEIFDIPLGRVGSSNSKVSRAKVGATRPGSTATRRVSAWRLFTSGFTEGGDHLSGLVLVRRKIEPPVPVSRRVVKQHALLLCYARRRDLHTSWTYDVSRLLQAWKRRAKGARQLFNSFRKRRRDRWWDCNVVWLLTDERTRNVNRILMKFRSNFSSLAQTQFLKKYLIRIFFFLFLYRQSSMLKGCKLPSKLMNLIKYLGD